MTALLRYSLLCILLALIGCKEGKDEARQFFESGAALGTSYHITYIARSDKGLQEGIDSVFRLINQSMSTYLPESDISRINQGDSTLVVDHMFREVFELAREVHQKTDGAFDPTVGVLVDAWGFGPGKAIAMDSMKTDSLMRYVGYEKVELTDSHTVRKADPRIRFDFNAIAKGYAIDRLALMMDSRGLEDYLIEVGGELVAKGENRVKEKKWVVGVDDPQAGDERTLKTALFLKDRALASSGNYRKFRIDSLSGIKYVHTIDPKTGYTRNSNILAATVLAPDCATADAYATAFMAMDLQASQDVVAADPSLDAYLIYLDGNGKTKEFMSPGFARELLK